MRPEKLEPIWINSRGAIARFDRGSIEIRLMDVQENPHADLALVALLVAVIQELLDETWCTLEEQKSVDTGYLISLLDAASKNAEQVEINSAPFLRLFGLAQAGCNGQEFWSAIIHRLTSRSGHPYTAWEDQWNLLLEQGTLARRICRQIGDNASKSHLLEVYQQLRDCLQYNQQFKYA